MKQSVELAEVLKAAIDSRLLDVHTALVGRVERVNLTARKVDVQPATQRVLQTEDGDLQTESLPVLQQVPLGALRAGAARIDMPVQAGDWVVVLFFEQNVGKWLSTGSVNVSPGDVERHGLTGAVAIPLLYPDADTSALPALSTTDVVVAITGGPQLRVTPTKVQVVGNLEVTGDVKAGTASVGTTRSLLTHTHGSTVGPTGAPLATP